MPDSTPHRKKLTPEQKKKRRRKAIRNRAIFGAACLLVTGLIIFSGFKIISSIIRLCSAPAEYVISGENSTEGSDSSAGSNTDTYTIPDNSRFIICLDAGHGGYDSGAVDYDGNCESTENLRMALMLKDELEKLGVTVVLTRDSDEYLTLSERCDTANEAGADLMLSIHRNFYEMDDSVCGIEAWINSSCPDEDYDIADRILTDLSKETEITNNRGVRHGTRDDGNDEDYAINSMSSMPSLILEMGYMSNGEDNRLFNDNMSVYCKTIADTVLKWCRDNAR